jgi:hypothetical protein
MPASAGRNDTGAVAVTLSHVRAVTVTVPRLFGAVRTPVGEIVTVGSLVDQDR